MAATVSFNPYSTSSPASTFLLETQGYVEGIPYDDTVARLWLMEGMLASSETLPMWGGQPITEQINVAGTNADGLGPQITRATAQSGAGGVTGFSTFAQMMHMVITPGGNTVPLAGSLNSVGFFRLGSNQRLAVQLDPALVSTLTGADQPIAPTTALYWSPTNHYVTFTTSSNFALPASIRLLSINSNSKIVNYNSGTGAVTWTTGNAGILLI